MVHLLASIGFSFLAVAGLALIGFTLATSRDAILLALGYTPMSVARMPRRSVRIRSAGRWQTVQAHSVQAQSSQAQSAQTKRAVA